MQPRPSSASTVRLLRTLPKAVFASVLFALSGGPVVAQGSDRTGPDARQREEAIEITRELIHEMNRASWRQAAYLIVEVSPKGDGSLVVGVAHGDQAKLVGAQKDAPLSERVWILPDGSRIFLRVAFFDLVEEIGCAVPRLARGSPVTLGAFPVSEDHLECFVRSGLYLDPL